MRIVILLSMLFASVNAIAQKDMEINKSQGTYYYTSSHSMIRGDDSATVYVRTFQIYSNGAASRKEAAVKIGDSTYYSGADGIIKIRLLPGKYKLSGLGSIKWHYPVETKRLEFGKKDYDITFFLISNLEGAKE
jgi:hypothetical protein